MPLYGKPREAFMGDGFDPAVTADSSSLQSLAQYVYGLMVGAVYEKVLSV